MIKVAVCNFFIERLAMYKLLYLLFATFPVSQLLGMEAQLAVSTTQAASAPGSAAAQASQVKAPTKKEIEDYLNDAFSGHCEKVREFISDKGPAYINSSDDNGVGALHCAIDGCFSNNLEQCKGVFFLLLEHGADPNKMIRCRVTETEYQNYSPEEFVQGCAQDRIRLYQEEAEKWLKRLADRSEDKTAFTPDEVSKRADQQAVDKFVGSVSLGVIKGLASFLDQYPGSIDCTAQVNAGDSFNYSALAMIIKRHFRGTAEQKHFAIFDLLLLKGASSEMRNIDNLTAAELIRTSTSTRIKTVD